MLIDVFSGAVILFVGVLTGYAICNVSWKRKREMEEAVVWSPKSLDIQE